jgi:hypothetical protein
MGHYSALMMLTTAAVAGNNSANVASISVEQLIDSANKDVFLAGAFLGIIICVIVYCLGNLMTKGK